MDADEIDSILRIQWRSLHNGPSYVEDFYYQVHGGAMLTPQGWSRECCRPSQQPVQTEARVLPCPQRPNPPEDLDLLLLSQAFLNKHFKGCNARWFAPERIRELAPSERGQAGAATFVSLEGLGRIPFSNIRRPKPLMDVGTGPGEQVRRLCSVRGRAGQLDKNERHSLPSMPPECTAESSARTAPVLQRSAAPQCFCLHCTGR